MAYLNFDGLDIKSLPKQVLKNSEDILSLATSGIATNNALGIHTIGIYEDTSYDNNTIYQNQSANNQPSDVITTPDLEPGDAYINSEDTSIFWIYSDLVELNWQGWIGPISFKGLQGIQGIQGKTGEQGPRGYTGLTGTRGNKWFTGATTGTIANPLIGDLFLQIPTFMVYHYNSEQLWEPLSSIKGQDGLNGTDGETGPQGYTPYIQSGYWYINGVNTNIKAEGVDGASINIQSGVWTTGTLPLFENTEVGDAYVVTNDPTYQPALYFNGVGGSTWTISPWGVGTQGPQGEDGEDGQDGVGVPSQGTAGQVLRKFSSDDYDTYWSDTDFGQLLKVGGTMTGKLTLNNNNVVNIFELINSLNTSYARLLFTSDSIQYSLGIGGSAAPISDLRNKFYIYDFTNSTPILYGNKDGLTIPGTLLVSGNMTCSGDILIPTGKTLKINNADVIADKAKVDASNLTSGNVDSFQGVLGYERVELVYDKDNASATYNWGYTSGLLGGITILDKDFSKYKLLRCHIRSYQTNFIFDIPLEVLDTSSYYSGSGISVQYSTGSGTTVPWIEIFVARVNSAKTSFACHTKEGSFNSTSFTNLDSYAGYHIYKIEGVY